MSRRLRLALLCVSFACAAPGLAGAHGGGLNAEGCHNERATGGYHCHRDAEPGYEEEWDDWEEPVEPDGPARSSAARAAFRRRHACPSTGRTTGPCPGFEVDHKIPLACGGPDTPDNMQWLTVEANRRKGDLGCSTRKRD
jgi:5-methylcytosine-specific restriction endonuclease McrA